MKIKNYFISNFTHQYNNSKVSNFNTKSSNNTGSIVSKEYEKFQLQNTRISKPDILKEFVIKMQISLKKRGFYRSSISSRQAITSYKAALSYKNDFSIVKRIANLQIPYDEIV